MPLTLIRGCQEHHLGFVDQRLDAAQSRDQLLQRHPWNAVPVEQRHLGTSQVTQDADADAVAESVRLLRAEPREQSLHLLKERANVCMTEQPRCQSSAHSSFHARTWVVTSS